MTRFVASTENDQHGQTGESRQRTRLLFVRPAVDAIAALALFMLATMTLASAPTAANPHLAGAAPQFTSTVTPAIADAGDRPIVEIATTSSPQAADAVYRRTSSSAAWVLLSLAFSILVAFNLAFLRHMRQAYAHPRNRPRE
jgi:hypothetical protein